jgi:GTP cyclohydrolase I
MIAATAGMPDIAGQLYDDPQDELDWVGMRGIHLPVRIVTGSGLQTVTASVDVFVDLVDARTRGIHMSRLYLLLGELVADHEVTPARLHTLLREMLASHREESSSARVRIAFDLCLHRTALKSDNAGWNRYPVVVEATRSGAVCASNLGVEVAYSSTCPCSAALARQLIQKAFDARFPGETASASSVRAWLGSDQGIVATPHSQRSIVAVNTRLADHGDELPIEPLIDRIEAALAAISHRLS